MGRLYQQPGSRFYFMDYVDSQGVRHRESTKRMDHREALDVLRIREGKVAAGEPVLPRADRIKYDELASDLRAYYEATGARDLTKAGFRLAHLESYFRGLRALAIDRPAITRYIAHRQEQKASNGTIRQELGVLARMLNLAAENGKLLRVPSFRGLKPREADARAGFFERDQYEAVRRHLPVDLQTAAAIAYAYGWRMQSEVLTLERRHLDLEAGTLRLDPGATKNRDGRVGLPYPGAKRGLDGSPRPCGCPPEAPRPDRALPVPLPGAGQEGRQAGRATPPGLPQGVGDGVRGGRCGGPPTP